MSGWLSLWFGNAKMAWSESEGIRNFWVTVLKHNVFDESTSVQREFPVLALTMGDPNGIGAEVMLKALDQLSPIRNWKPLIFGDFRVLEKVRDKLGLDLDLLKKVRKLSPRCSMKWKPRFRFWIRRTFKRMAAWNMQSLGRNPRSDF